ncbi:MAG: rhodanese-like domain-containing protein [Acidobacteria bacterium]|nr:rhodanese-like domain-containing protein [Acidobacteriota bacterium]
MLRQNHTWTTTLGVAAALALTTWVTTAALQTRMAAHGDQRVTQGITLFEFQRLYGEGAVLLVDVRDVGSYEAGHIPGAIQVWLDESAGSAAVRAQVDDIRRQAGSRLVVTYCACPSEASSLRAARLLAAHGLTARALIGGYHGWVDAGGPTYTLPHVPPIPSR